MQAPVGEGALTENSETAREFPRAAPIPALARPDSLRQENQQGAPKVDEEKG